jgi:hypothetical protein
MAIAAMFATASLLLAACSEDPVDLAAVAAETFSTESVWRGDARHVTVTITDAHVLEILAVEVYLDQLGFSPAVYERMNRTRALDGTQSATSTVANVTWTYHPDNGLQAVFEREEER